MQVGFEFKEKVLALDAAIKAKHTQMPILLHEIHKALKLQPENVTLLSEEEIAIIVSGLEHQTNTFLAESVAKNSKKPNAVKAILSKGIDAF